MKKGALEAENKVSLEISEEIEKLSSEEFLRVHLSDTSLQKDAQCRVAERKLLEMKKNGIENFEVLEILSLILDILVVVKK